VALDQERQRLEQALGPLYRIPAGLALVPDCQGLGAPRTADRNRVTVRRAM
jgi:hypothetical protein